jgi:hypothetical protein
MAHKIIESIRHDYDPVNKYIDEKARLRRTKSIWKNTKSAALGLIALGVFLILAAYAYHIFKKPHKLTKYNEDIISDNNDVNKYNNKIEDIKKKIEEKNRNLSNNPSSEKDKKEIERLEKELNELKSQRDNVVYDETVSVFKSKTVDVYTITTGYSWNKVDDLRFGKNHENTWCYIESSFTPAKYYFNNNRDQTILLKELNLRKDEADEYQKYCKN